MIRSLARLLADDGLMGRAIRFALVGGVSTLAHALLTHWTVSRLLVAPTTATVIGYLLAIPLNFLLQRTFTFRSGQSLRRELPKYLVVHGLNIGGSFLIMYAITNLAGADYRWGILATMVVVPAMVFAAMNVWVFRRTRT
jgi:putative flippase GtrA